MSASGEAVRGLVKSRVKFGNSLAASPLANSLAGEAREGIWRLRRCSLLARSRIPPATQARELLVIVIE